LIKSLLEFGLTRSAIIVLGLVVFCAAGLVAFSRLNIEAYPNPAPVILEITAQAAGLSAEEMEKYYTIPMEVGLYPTPGVVNIRSTSFYGLSFVRVTFKYGVDFYFALTQASISLQQNVNLPGNQVAQIQQSSLVGEIYRYQVVGPPHFGLTNLRTVQDWIALRRLSTIPGVVAVNSWGGTTKEFEVAADLNKLQAYNITMPRLLAALGNSNINVGGREITVGQQSVNIRGVGLVDDGGNDDIARGRDPNECERSREHPLALDLETRTEDGERVTHDGEHLRQIIRRALALARPVVRHRPVEQRGRVLGIQGDRTAQGVQCRFELITLQVDRAEHAR